MSRSFSQFEASRLARRRGRALVVDVRLDESIGGFRGELRVRRLKLHVYEPAALDGAHGEGTQKSAHASFGIAWLRAGFDVGLGQTVPRVERFERPARERTAAKHLVLGLVVLEVRIIVLDDGSERDYPGRARLDEQPRTRLVNRSGPMVVDRRCRAGHHQNGKDQPPTSVQDVQTRAQEDVICPLLSN